MNKRFPIALLVAVTFVLTGCMNDVSELYEGHAYDTGDFKLNYYSTWDSTLESKIATSGKTYDIPLSKGFQINEDADLEQLWLPEEKYYDVANQKLYSTVADTPHEDAGYGYGPSNNLISIDTAFARGFLSRLYDGRVHCDGITFAQTRVQIDGSGYGTLFPKELNTYTYFAVSLRGADETEARNVDVNIHLNVTFYVYDHVNALYVPYLFQMQNYPIMTNSGGKTTIVGFYFSLAMSADLNLLKRASGMSITFELAESYEDYAIDRDDTSGKDHFALMLYEVLLPRSTWN
jgi:hypothetical protein